MKISSPIAFTIALSICLSPVAIAPAAIADDNESESSRGPGSAYIYRHDTSVTTVARNVWDAKPAPSGTGEYIDFNTLYAASDCADVCPLWPGGELFDGNTYVTGVKRTTSTTVTYSLSKDGNKDGWDDYDHNHDGWADDDHNKDGYSDSDHNRDGFGDDDHNKDGYSDSDHNKDGWVDNDHNRDGWADNDGNRDGWADSDHDRDGWDDYDHNKDGWVDTDLDHDGYAADDTNRDGWSDKDRDHDGWVDTDLDHDGYSDGDYNHDGWDDEDLDRDGWVDTDDNHDGWGDDDADHDGIATPRDSAKVPFCHATSSRSNPYVTGHASMSGLINGHIEGGGVKVFPTSGWTDIVPPFQGFAGQNWTERGKAIFANDCDVKAATPATPVVVPQVPANWVTKSKVSGQTFDCLTFTTPTVKSMPLTLAGDFRVDGPYDYTGDPMVSSAKGGTMTRTPNNDGVIDYHGKPVSGVSDLGQAVLKRLGTRDTTVFETTTPTPYEAYYYGITGSDLSYLAPTQSTDQLLDHGRYVGIGNKYQSVVNYVTFDTFDTSLMPILYPSVMKSPTYFTSHGGAPVFVKSFDDNIVSHTTSRFKVTCQTNTAKGMLYYEPVTGPNDGNVRNGLWEDDENTYTYQCADAPAAPRTDDMMICDTYGTYGPNPTYIDGKPAAPATSIDKTLVKDENGRYIAQAFGDPYGFQWKPVKVQINSGRLKGTDVETLGPEANVLWERNWDLADDASPILLHDLDANLTVDRNYALQPYHLFTDDKLTRKPTTGEKWTPLSDTGTYDASVERWIGLKDTDWFHTQQGVWVKFFQSSTDNSQGWTLTPKYRVTATLPTVAEYITGFDIDEDGNITGTHTATGEQMLRQSYVCPAAPVTLDVKRVS